MTFAGFNQNSHRIYEFDWFSFNTLGFLSGISWGLGHALTRWYLRISIRSTSIESFILGIPFRCLYRALLAVIKNCRKQSWAMLELIVLRHFWFMWTLLPEITRAKLHIVSAFEAFGSANHGIFSDEDYDGVIRNACPGAGACGGMYTAKYHVIRLFEAMGMSLP